LGDLPSSIAGSLERRGTLGNGGERTLCARVR
jgi:hypothetical protein